MWEPIVNCGYYAGNNPTCWNGESFTSESECEKWIDEHIDEFTEDELGGCVYPRKIMN